MLGTFPAPPNTQSYDRDPDRHGAGIQTDGSESGGVRRLPAILRIERTAFPSTFPDRLSTGIVTHTKLIEHTDIVRQSPTRRLQQAHVDGVCSIRGVMRGWIARTTFRT